MKRTIGIMLIMVMLFSILGGCDNNSNNSEELPEVSNSVAEQVGKSSENATIKNDVTESRMTKDTTTLSSDETTTMANFNFSTSNTSSSYNTDESTVVDNYVYKDPTVFVDGMYKIGSDNLPNSRKLGMGDVYVEKEYLEKQHSYYNYTLKKNINFDASHIVTDVGKMPSNYKLYAYVVDTIPNWLYEKNISLNECKDATPLEVYLTTYDDTLYNSALKYITEFYFSIGCISYLSEVGPIWGNLGSTIYTLEYYSYDDKLYEYEDYVRENKIKLATVAEPLLPIVYCKGDYTFIRTKVTVNAESPVTNNIKMFLHDDLVLKNGENVFYIDVPLACVMKNTVTGKQEIWEPKVYIGEMDISKYIIA